MKRLLLFAITVFMLFTNIIVLAVTPQCIKDFIKNDFMKNADFAFIVKDINSGEIVYDYNIETGIVPASTLKTITTATALEILGANFRYETLLQYDGEIKKDILYGNIYIKGSGDPTLGSEYIEPKTKFLNDWVEAIQKLGIKAITGQVIADESIFDNQGIHPKWQAEDLGLSYAAGSYGLNIYDNKYKLFIRSGEIGSTPSIEFVHPDIKLKFINMLTVSINPSGESIFGVPFSNERFLNGSVAPNSYFTVYGDIPDPALYLANLLNTKIKNSGITVEGNPTCSRLLIHDNKPLPQERWHISTTYSPPMSEIVKITNHLSRNLFADALLKTIGTMHIKTDEPINSFDKGIIVLKKYWTDKGVDSSLKLYDGSGLTSANRITATFVSDILEYMANKSSASEAFINSLPIVGMTGNVKSFLRDTCLHGKLMLKSGWMTGVKCYAGYFIEDNKKYAVGIFTNNYHCSTLDINKAIENILLNLFSQ